MASIHAHHITHMNTHTHTLSLSLSHTHTHINNLHCIPPPLQVVLYGTGCGMSAAFWRNQHNKHHATPQKVDHDVDLDTLPLVLFNVSCKEGKQKNLFNKYAESQPLFHTSNLHSYTHVS